MGLAAASTLAGRGVQVTVLEAGKVLGGTSSRGLAWANASNKAPLEYFQLNVAGIQAHSRLSNAAEQPWFHQSGTINTQSYRSGLGDMVHQHKKWGYPVLPGTLNDFIDVDGHQPYGRERAAFYPSEGWVDVKVFGEEALTRLTNSSGTLIESARVTSLNATRGTYRVGLAGGREVEADVVVNAAGTGAPDIAALVGRNLPMRNRWGIVAKVETPRVQLGRVIMHDLIDIRPGSGRIHFLHSDSVDATLSADPENSDAQTQVADLLHRARRLHPAFEGSMVRGHTVGLRPIPEDGLPIIGMAADRPGYFEAITHSGLTLAPVIGEIIADQILEGPGLGFDLEAFTPDRFSS